MGLENLNVNAFTHVHETHYQVTLNLEPLPLVRHIPKVDVQLLENKLVNGYHEGLNGSLCFHHG